MPASSQSTLSFRFPHQKPVCTSTLPQSCYMARPLHSFLFDHPNNIWWVYRSLSSTLRNFPHSPVTSSLLGPNVLLSTLFPNTVSLRVVTT
jgi:hypothetical protein